MIIINIIRRYIMSVPSVPPSTSSSAVASSTSMMSASSTSSGSSSSIRVEFRSFKNFNYKTDLKAAGPVAVGKSQDDFLYLHFNTVNSVAVRCVNAITNEYGPGSRNATDPEEIARSKNPFWYKGTGSDLIAPKDAIFCWPMHLPTQTVSSGLTPPGPEWGEGTCHFKTYLQSRVEAILIKQGFKVVPRTDGVKELVHSA